MLLLLLTTLLLLLPLAMLLWRPRSQDARQSWLVRLQHRVAWGALCWAAAWQQKRLAQSTLHAGQSQQQALRRCLRRAQGPHCPLRGSTDISTFRNHLPLTKASQAQEEESGEQPLPPTSNRYHGEASLQVNGEGWNPTPSEVPKWSQSLPSGWENKQQQQQQKPQNKTGGLP